MFTSIFSKYAHGVADTVEEQDTLEDELSKIRSLPEVLFVNNEGTVYRSLDEYKLDTVGEDVQDTWERVSDNPYVKTYKWIRADRHGGTEKVYHYTTQSSDYISDELSEIIACDYSILGSGHYSQVFECPWDDTKVIKAGFGPGCDGDIWSDGWLSWAAFCMYMKAKGDYPMLPTIHTIVFRENSFVALIDRYDATWKERESLGDLSENIRHSYAALRKVVGERYGDPTLEPKESMIEAAKEWRSHKLCPGCYDCHNENVMIDLKNDTVVLIDPCSRDYTLDDEREQIFKALGLIP